MQGAILPGNSTVELRTFDVPDAGPRRGPGAHEEHHDLRLRHPLHLPPAPRQGAGGLPAGDDRGARALRADRRARPRLPPLRGGRPRHRLPHLRLRPVQRLPPRLHDLLHQPLAPRLRLAAPRRHGPLHPRRGEGPRPPARRAHLLRRRAGRVRLRHGLRGPRAGRRQRQRRRPRHRPRPGRPRDRDAGEGDGRRAHRRHRRPPRAARARALALASSTTCCRPGPTTWRRCGP